MYQLVNLYQPVFRQQPKILSAVTLMVIIGIVIFLMSVLYVKALSTIHGLEKTSADLSQSYNQLDTRLSSIISTSTPASDVRTSDEVIRLQAQIDDRSELLNQIDGLFIGKQPGFGDVFETLAKTSLPGLWLTGIQLDELGNIKISGTTLDPKLVPRYLQLIATQPSLSSLGFGSVSLSRDDSKPPELDFVLSYKPPGERR